MKTPRIIVATLALAVACTTTGTAAVAQSGTHKTEDQGGISVGDTAYVDTEVATLWTEPNIARDIDRPSITNPVDLDRWNANMEDTETRGWLTGHLETQALYGSEVEVDEISGDWAKVVVHGQDTPRDPRGYPGWVPTRQLADNGSFAQQRAQSPRAVVTAKKAGLTGESGPAGGELNLSFNTELPVVGHHGDAVTVALPDGGRGTVSADDVEVYLPGQTPPRPSGEDVVATGKQFLGLRYLWAGMSSYGYDCSGFTYNAYRAHGINIPRDADAQAEYGTSVAEKDLRPGDLLFFAKPGGTGAVHHVGMYVGDGKMIHAPNESTSVSIVDWKQWDSQGEFSGAQRMM